MLLLDIRFYPRTRAINFLDKETFSRRVFGNGNRGSLGQAIDAQKIKKTKSMKSSGIESDAKEKEKKSEAKLTDSLGVLSLRCMHLHKMMRNLSKNKNDYSFLGAFL